MTSKKWVYQFEELDIAEQYVGGEWDDIRGLLGGKGANLAEMIRIGLPVPPGFTTTTEACNAYLATGGVFPDDMWNQVLEAINLIEQSTTKGFGDIDCPLLVSCRSGAKFSMPGMMDTVLNIGLNDATVASMVKLTNDARFVYDAYRRLIQMFGSVVMGIPNEKFEEIIDSTCKKVGVKVDSELNENHWQEITNQFKTIFRGYTQINFPQNPLDQLKMATEAVFKSWNGKRAIDYRNASGIAHNLGTAVNIMTMVFGNMGKDCATGVAMTRHGSTGEIGIEGDFLVNAQGEDVVSGIRQTRDISELATIFPKAFNELEQIASKLEKHYHEMQDLEFTIEKGKLWMLQTRDGKRTAQAAVRIAVEMVNEGLIDKKVAVQRVSPEHVDFFLHPQFSQAAQKKARNKGLMVAQGLNVSPGAASGLAVFDANLAEKWVKEEGKNVIMVRPETKPDDVHGMLVSEGILTSRGGRTSHAALVARQFGKPAVVGVAALEIDLFRREMQVGNNCIREGDLISIDGNTGEVFLGEIEKMVPDIKDPWLLDLLSWADEFRALGVWANADYPEDAKRAREYGAEGIGLCRSEHMFFESDRLPLFQKMIMADLAVDQRDALNQLLRFQRKDFAGLFRVMNGLPVIVRLIDPPLHEFLPDLVELMVELSDLKLRIRDTSTLTEIDELLHQIRIQERIREKAVKLKEQNPMLGMRGVRLGIHIPDLTKMQVRAIFEAACQVSKEGLTVLPKVMIPLVAHANELKVQRHSLEQEARAVMEEQKIEIDYKFGTMIELPRAALTADQIAEYAEFFSYGTNDLTQTTYGISRDDAESGFLVEYVTKKILPENPFTTLDKDGVAQLMKIGIKKGRQVRPDLECGICGEHGGDPQSIAICHELGLSYVSCSPFRVPVARLAAAHASLRQ